MELCHGDVSPKCERMQHWLCVLHCTIHWTGDSWYWAIHYKKRALPRKPLGIVWRRFWQLQDNVTAYLLKWTFAHDPNFGLANMTLVKLHVAAFCIVILLVLQRQKNLRGKDTNPWTLKLYFTIGHIVWSSQRLTTIPAHWDTAASLQRPCSPSRVHSVKDTTGKGPEGGAGPHI